MPILGWDIEVCVTDIWFYLLYLILVLDVPQAISDNPSIIPRCQV